MQKLTEKEWDIIKYSLNFLHDRDLSLIYKEEFISLLENTMEKLNITFTPQSEIDKKKIKEYIVRYNNDKIKISLNGTDKKHSSAILEDGITRIAHNNNILPEFIKILMNENTFDTLSKIFITLQYTNLLFYCPVSIEENCDNGELRIVV